MAICHLRARQRDDEDRMVASPIEQILDERDEALVGPVDVLEHHHERPLLGEPLEEAPPGGEEILAVGRGPVAEAEQLEQPRLDPVTLVLVADVGLERRRAASPQSLPRPSSSRIFARPRTISASAQYATPSP